MENVYYLAAYFILCAICFFIITNKEKRIEARKNMSVTMYNVFMFIIYLTCPILLLIDIIVIIFKAIVLIVLYTVGLLLRMIKLMNEYRLFTIFISIVLFALLAMLKYNNIIECSWWIVTLPISIPILLFTILFITFIILLYRK